MSNTESTEWQPMERAPRDGRNILVFDLDLGAVVAYLLNSDWLLVGGKFIAYPTHWMPLPDPPVRR